MLKALQHPLVLLLLVIIPFGSPCLASGGHPNQWKIHDLLTHYDFWSVIGQEFSMQGYDKRPEVQQEIRWLTSHPYYLLKMTQNASPYIYYILNQTRDRGMPAEIALIPMIESNYDPSSTSRRGAAGLWQMMSHTAKGFSLSINNHYDGRRDVVASTRAALDYLTYLHDFFGDWLLAIAAYDSGVGVIIEKLKYNKKHNKPQDFWSLDLSQETSIYIPRLLALANIIRNHEDYGVQLVPVANKPFFSMVSIEAPFNLNEIAEKSGADIKMIRKLNPEFRRNTIQSGGTYTLLLPVKKADAFNRHPAQNKNIRHYTVKPGDSLGRIAHRFHVKINALKKENQLKNDIIKPGQLLIIPN